MDREMGSISEHKSRCMPLFLSLIKVQDPPLLLLLIIIFAKSRRSLFSFILIFIFIIVIVINLRKACCHNAARPTQRQPDGLLQTSPRDQGSLPQRSIFLITTTTTTTPDEAIQLSQIHPAQKRTQTMTPFSSRSPLRNSEFLLLVSHITIYFLLPRRLRRRFLLEIILIYLVFLLRLELYWYQATIRATNNSTNPGEQRPVVVAWDSEPPSWPDILRSWLLM